MLAWRSRIWWTRSRCSASDIGLNSGLGASLAFSSASWRATSSATAFLMSSLISDHSAFVPTNITLAWMAFAILLIARVIDVGVGAGGTCAMHCVVVGMCCVARIAKAVGYPLLRCCACRMRLVVFDLGHVRVSLSLCLKVCVGVGPVGVARSAALWSVRRKNVAALRGRVATCDVALKALRTCFVDGAPSATAALA